MRCLEKKHDETQRVGEARHLKRNVQKSMSALPVAGAD